MAFPGTFKLGYRAQPTRVPIDVYADPLGFTTRRVGRILASISSDIDEGGQASVRQILRAPRELYRVEVERPDLAYLRTTILDRETLVALLEQADEQAIRDRFTIRSGS